MQESTNNFSFAARILFYIILIIILTLGDTTTVKSDSTLSDVIIEYKTLFIKHKNTLMNYLSHSADKEREFKRLVKTKDVSRNFASVTSGARIVEKSFAIEQASAILNDNEKSMLFACYLVKTSNISFIIDLSEDFYMKEFILVSRSFFSNYISDFTVETSIDYVSEGWTKHGIFHNNEENIANLFSLENYYLVRFMRVRILNTYEDTNNYYCSINQLKVYGKTITYSTKVWKEKLIKDKEDKQFIENIVWDDSDSVLNAALNKNMSTLVNNADSKTSPIKSFLELIAFEETKENNGEDPYQEIYQFFSNKINYLHKHLTELKSYVHKNDDFDPRKLSDPEKGFLFYQLLENKQIEHNFVKLHSKVARIQGLENKIYSTNRRLNMIQTNIEYISQNIYSSYSRIDTVSKRYASLKNEIEGLNSRLTILQNNYDTLVKTFLTICVVVCSTLVIMAMVKGRFIISNKTIR